MIHIIRTFLVLLTARLFAAGRVLFTNHPCIVAEDMSLGYDKALLSVSGRRPYIRGVDVLAPSGYVGIQLDRCVNGVCISSRVRF